eukprot:6364679-Pyramimonas_sp.AAC.1
MVVAMVPSVLLAGVAVRDTAHGVWSGFPRRSRPVETAEVRGRSAGTRASIRPRVRPPGGSSLPY